MDKNKNVVQLFLQRLKERYIYLFIITIVVGFFACLYNAPNNSIVSNEENQVQIAVGNNEIKQDIKIDYNNPKEIIINLGDNKKAEESSTYNISILNGDETIVNYDFDLSSIEENGDVALVLPKIENKVEVLTVQIKGNNNSELVLKGFKSDTNPMYVNGIKGENSLSTIVTYSRFPIIYMIIIILLYILLCLIILGIDMKKIHNSVFITIVLLGGFSAVFNPILDNPDEHAHIARAEVVSRGTFFLSGDSENRNISKSIESIIGNIHKTFENDELSSTEGNYNYSGSTNNYAETNIFISYIPQAIGILLAKILSINTLSILIFGRLFNLVAYALMVRYALKTAPCFKLPIAVISMMPMVIFIAASFNPDASTYGLTFILISYFLKLYKEENIDVKEIAIFSAISILLGFIKLPYCILGGLIIFIPKQKFKSNKIYYTTFLFVILIACTSLGWGLKSIMGSSSGSGTFNEFYTENNISVNNQIIFILQNPISFAIRFFKALFDNFNIYITQMSVFGWLTYSLNPTIMMLYPAFLIIVMFTYPTEMIISKKTKAGLALVTFGVYAVTNLILYLSWTPVGSSGIEGVQGRYFCSLLVLLTLFSNKQLKNIDEEKMSFKYLFIAIAFVAIFLVTLVNRAY